MARYGWLAVVAVAMAALAIAAAPPQAQRPAGTGEAAQEAGPQVEVIGLEIMKPNPAHWQEGTTVTFRIDAPDKPIVALDEDKTMVGLWEDDKGTNLAEKMRDWRNIPVNVSEDRRMALFKISSEAVPAAGAREMNLAVIVGVRCGSEEKTVEQQDFALKIGSELAVGPAPMKIDKIGGPWGESKMQVTLRGTTDPEAVKELVFLGADGRPIKARLTQWGSMEDPSHTEYEQTYALAEKVETVTVRVVYFAKVETQAVAMLLKMGIGF